MAKILLRLIRGLPGSGKTTLARAMKGYTHIESDMYFHLDGAYVFVGEKLPSAHVWCLAQVKAALERGENVVVSNTFICLWEMQAYKDLGYAYEVIVANGSFSNQHGVPADLIARMRAKWQDETVMPILNVS